MKIQLFGETKGQDCVCIAEGEIESNGYYEVYHWLWDQSGEYMPAFNLTQDIENHSKWYVEDRETGEQFIAIVRS